jgi:ABC-type glutathione transport system ATPase component
MTVALSIKDLSIAFARREGGGASGEALDRIALEVRQGEILALVGESGSGKTIAALAIMGLLPAQAHITSGAIAFEGRDMLALNDTERRRLRGARIGMVFQEPMTSLNPVLTIGRQMSEALVEHKRLSRSEVRARVLAMIARVGLSDGPALFGRYPHELSGGMRQRVMIAMTMVLEPALLIADEPTTALDVTVQAQILDLLRDLVRAAGASLLLITHDMGVVAEMADRVAVMRHGRIVETRAVRDLFDSPSQAYTCALLAAVPHLDGPGPPLLSDRRKPSAPALRLERISKSYPSGGLFRSRDCAKAVAEVSLSVMPGETLALVGESGSGKSTLGRAAARLVDVDEGRVIVDGEDLTRVTGRRLRAARSRVQMIFQDPFASLDPRFTLLASIAEPMLVRGLADRGDAPGKAMALMERVGLSSALADRLPHELSGGQRQRISIARALAVEPKIIVADEPTSALDVSVQAQVLTLLAELQEERGLAFLFITHDLAIVRRIAHRVAVMRGGALLELGSADAVLRNPRHPYTQALLAAAPVLDPTRRRQARPTATPLGPAAALSEFAPGHWVAR